MRWSEHSIAGVSRPWRWVAVAILALSLGCRGGSDEEDRPQVETVDVAPSLQITTEEDETAVERPPALVGLMPGDFPPDLPLYLPASLIDFGTTDDGWRYVDLLTPDSQTKVEGELGAMAREKGWAADGTGGAATLRKGSQRVRLRIEDARPGTVYRYEYRL